MFESHFISKATFKIIFMQNNPNHWDNLIMSPSSDFRKTGFSATTEGQRQNPRCSVHPGDVQKAPSSHLSPHLYSHNASRWDATQLTGLKVPLHVPVMLLILPNGEVFQFETWAVNRQVTRAVMLFFCEYNSDIMWLGGFLYWGCIHNRCLMSKQK